MADANIKACSYIEEIVEKAEEVKEEQDESSVNKWTLLNANSEQSDNENSQLLETQENWVIVKRDAVSKNNDVVPKDNNIASQDDNLSNNHSRLSRVEDNFDNSDGSDSISVITENSDIDSNNQFSPVNDKCQINNTQDRFNHLVLELRRQRGARNNLITYALGVISIGFFLYHHFTVPESFQFSNGIDRERFKMATYSIDNIYKELPQVKAMLNEIKARISDDAKIRKNFLVQLSEIIDSSNKMSNKPVMAVIESFNSNSYPLNQLQVSLHVLSSLAFIDDNIPFKNEINKILDTVNSTKAFYETLISFNNNTQNNAAVLEFLQSGNDIIRITSEQLLFDLVEKMNKVMLNVYKKFAKVRQKLSKTLCHLKNVLPDDELLKQLTENNFFKNYDKLCFLNHNFKKLNNEKSRTESANNVKQQIKKADAVLHTRHKKKNIQKIYDNGENSLKNERNRTQSINNSTTTNSKKIKLNMHNNYNKIRDKLYEVLSYLDDVPSDPKLEQSTKNCGEKSGEPINRYEGKDNYPQSVKIQKNDFDSTLIIKRQLNDTCSFPELNKWLELDNDMITPNIEPDPATESNNVNVNNKYEINNKKIMLNNFTNILMEEKSGSKQENDFKSKHSTKKPVNKTVYSKERDGSPRMKEESKVFTFTFNVGESKESLFNEHTKKQDDEPYILGKDDINRSDARKKQWRSDASDWYFQRADSRKNARRNVKDQRNWYFQRADSRKNARKHADHRNSKFSRRKKRYPHRIVDIWNNLVHNYNKFLRNVLEENVI